MRTGRNRKIATELLASLMKGPRTQSEMLEMVECTESTLRLWLFDFREAGLVYLGKRHPNVYHLQAKPFEMDDLPLKRKRKVS